MHPRQMANATVKMYENSQFYSVTEFKVQNAKVHLFLQNSFVHSFLIVNHERDTFANANEPQGRRAHGVPFTNYCCLFIQARHMPIYLLIQYREYINHYPDATDVNGSRSRRERELGPCCPLLTPRLQCKEWPTAAGAERLGVVSVLGRLFNPVLRLASRLTRA